MSGFDDNPFADPHPNQSTNAPVGGGASGGVQTAFLDSYNPFDDAAKKNQSTGAGIPSASSQFQPPPFQPAVLPDSGSSAPPAYSAVSAQRVTTEELERRQRELESRAADLQRREDEQKRVEAETKALNRENNWPPIPSFIPIQPCFYQDIEVDIPIEYRRIVSIGYYVWIAHAALLLVNLVGTLVYFIGSQGSSRAGTTFGTAILFLILVVPCSFLCWYRPLYKAFKSDSSFNFFTFFLFFFVQCVLMIINTIGLDFASCGWINSFTMIGKTPGVAIFMMIIASAFTALSVVDVLLLIRVHRLYRNTGASFEKAKQEFSHGVATNPTVRNAAADFGTSAVRSSVNTGPASRY